MSPILRITGSDETSAAWNSAQNQAARAIGNIKNLLPGLGAALSAAGMITFAEHALEAGEQMNKLSQRTGIAVEDLSALKFAAGQANVPIEGLALGIKKLSVSAIAATDAQSEMGHLWKALGVSAQDASGKMRPTQDTLLSMAERFSKMEDGAQKTALAVKFFGKTGDEMIPFLNLGKEKIQALTAEAQRLGLVMSKDAAEAAEKASDNLKVLRSGAEALSVSLINNLAPAIGRITEAMRESMKDHGALYALWIGLGGTAAEALGLGMKESAEKARELTRELNDLARASAQLKNADLNPATRKREQDSIDAQIAAKVAELNKLRAEIETARKDQDKAKAAGESIEQREKDRKTAEDFILALKKEAETYGMAKDQIVVYNAAKLGAKFGAGSVDIAIRLRNEAAEWAKVIAAQERLKFQTDYLSAAYAQFAKAQDAATGALDRELISLETDARLWDKSNEERKTAALLTALVDAGISKESDSYRDYEARLNAVNGKLEYYNELKADNGARAAGLKSLQDEISKIQFETVTLRLNNDQRERALLLKQQSEAGVNVLINPQGAELMDQFDAAQASRETERRRLKIEEDKKALDQQAAQLILSLQTSDEIEQAHFVAENEMLAQAWAQRLITEQQYMAALERLQQKHSAKSVQQKYEEEKAKVLAAKVYGQLSLADAQFFASQLGVLMQSKSRQAFEVGKVAAIASATIDAYAAASSAYAVGAKIGGPWTGAAFAAIALLAQFTRIQALNATSFGGGSAAVGTFAANPSTGLPESPTSSGFAPVASPVAAAQTAQVQPRIINLTIQGEGMVSTSWIRDVLIPGLNEAHGDGVRILVN